MFKIHFQLERDCVLIGHFPLSSLLLNLDAHYPWFILVPQREDITEVFQLNEQDQRQLMIESNTLSALLYEHFQADKMNVAALGNVVSQLHVHHIVRYRDDPCWPQPVWGVVSATPYTEKTMLMRLEKLTAKLALIGCTVCWAAHPAE